MSHIVYGLCPFVDTMNPLHEVGGKRGNGEGLI